MKTEVIYEDESLIVVRKPPGLATQSANPAEADAVSELKKHTGGEIFPVHRLDQPVDGLLVFGKKKDIAGKLGTQLGEKGLSKQYRALVLGTPEPAEGELRGLHKKEGAVAKIRPEDSSRKPSGEWKRAVLSYRTLTLPEALKEKARALSGSGEVPFGEVAICLQTGRFHQIRAQFAAAGHPLLGDRKYGNDACKALAEGLGLRTVCLCANALTFTHPVTGAEMTYEVKPIWEE